MPNAEIVPMFSGDPETTNDPNAVSASTFLKKFRSHMRDLAATTDAAKIEAFEDYLVEDSTAEKWFKDLQAGAGAVTTWMALQAAFTTRFPGPQKAEKTVQEWERQLVGARIKAEDLDTTVQVGGTTVYAYIHFASQLLEMAKLAKIHTTSSGIWQSRDALPDVIRDKIPANPPDWIAYTDAIMAVDRVHIKEGVAKAKKNQEIERVVKELTNRDKRQPPTTPISKMSAQLAQTGLTTPRAQNTADTNPFASGGGGRGNLFQGPRQLTDAEIEALKQIATRLGRSLLQDNPDGRREYARRIALWETMYANSRPRLEAVGYPLSPGTVAPGSGECFSCGKITIPFHRSNNCQGLKVPQKEATFRSIVNKHFPAQTAQVNAVANWMDFADVDEEDFAQGSSE
ncbi:hypothetical protein R3P38DRAFT_3186970 [Favolaschia claudopus]|uniref:Gag protein n=1 Tax=Favolaschia claudopus TaxID=2862362 RepID=A0AAW0C3D9_9AGAR